jgi:MFS family permease
MDQNSNRGRGFRLSEPLIERRTIRGQTFVADLVGPEQRGLAYGWFNAAVGIGTLPASLLFGWLYQGFGALTAFGVGAALAMLAGVVLLGDRPEQVSR